MKRETFPQIIFTDEIYSNQMTKELKAAQAEMQKLLDCWNGFNLKPITTYGGLFRLFYDPDGVYKDAGLSDSLPVEIYIQAAKCRNIEHHGRLELWIIEDGKTVSINESEFHHFTHINDIVVQNEAQAQFARDAIEFARLSNHLADTIMGLPTGRQMGEPYRVVGNPFQVLKKVELQTEYLQELIKFVL